MKTDTKLIKFLRKHGALRNFKYALKYTRDIPCEVEECDDISGGFVWDKSREGHEYWSKLSNLYDNDK